MNVKVNDDSEVLNDTKLNVDSDEDMLDETNPTNSVEGLDELNESDPDESDPDELPESDPDDLDNGDSEEGDDSYKVQRSAPVEVLDAKVKELTEAGTRFNRVGPNRLLHD